ncbi:MAG: polyphenol oxidase family protein [Roseimicrobium sp.]
MRHPSIDVAVDRALALERLAHWHLEIVQELGFQQSQLATAKQVHGAQVAVVNGATPPLEDTDGLVCNAPGTLIGIYVADCCALYLLDERTGAFGVLHSGKKGTELNITGHAIATMRAAFGTEPRDLVVQLSPCIRPPAYEVDFAATIRQQAREAGVLPERVHDDFICTAQNLEKFYSYRAEKGQTGRMLALLGCHA